MEEIYKGYQSLIGDTEKINQFMAEVYPGEFYPNEYLIIQNTDDGSESEMRWDGEKFVGLKLPPSKYIKGKNALQRCALDMLNNPNITVCAVLGTYGSGKTRLTLSMAKYAVVDKGTQSTIVGIREPVGHGKEIGYLKGDFESKTDRFFMPLAQQLDGGMFELESLKQRGMLESNILYFLKGLTYSDSVIVVDESEDLNEEQIRLVGTRVGENSRIFFNGDYKQSVSRANTSNPLIKMCNELKGSPLFGCIYLEADVRSETSQLFANLFEGGKGKWMEIKTIQS